jgi:putative ABC transport system permease protein
MRALDRKLLRDVLRMRGQMLSIALVVAAGVMSVVTLGGTYMSLAASLEQFYAEYRFADVFASLKRAPASVERTVAQIPGVAAVHTRVRQLVTLDVPGLDEPAVGMVLSIPPRAQHTLNDIHLVSGRYIDAARIDEVLVSESFATANGLRAGDHLGAVINGRWRRLLIVGIAISPDYIGELAPGTVFPDDRRFAIVRMNADALAAAAGMQSAFNDVSVQLMPGAREQDVIAALDHVLEPYGGLGAYGRAQHDSHQTVVGELEQNRVTGTIVPAIFLAVAAFLLNIVLSRQVGTQREQIAVLKAFGYSSRAIGLHYLYFALTAVVAGVVIGTASGVWLGRGLTVQYGSFFRFPSLAFRLEPWLVALAAAVSVLAAAVGALTAVRSAVRLPPAEAMRPEPPARFRAGPFERLALARRMAASSRMIVRNIERRPARSMSAALGVALSVALLVISLLFYDAVARMLDVQFNDVQREDIALHFGQPRPQSVRHDIAHLHGVSTVELFRAVPVRLTRGPAERSVVLTGLEADNTLRAIVDGDRAVHRVPPHGVLLSAQLATVLGVGIGDTVHARLLEGRRTQHDITVAGTVEDLFGLNAYIDYRALHRMMGEAPSASGAFVSTEATTDIPALNAVLKRLPAVVGAYSPAALRRTFQQQMDENLMLSVTFLVTLSGILSVGVIYNTARIALSERGRELASLRVLGFTRREVATLLFGEQAVITLVAIPLGWLIGRASGAFILSLFDMERYRIPLVIDRSTYLVAAAFAVASALLAGLLVRRNLNRMDILSALKTPE